MNKKGFFSVELLISFTLVAFIALAMFRAVLLLNERLFYQQGIYQITLLVGNMSNNIQADLLENLNNPLTTNVTDCGDDCFEFNFRDGERHRVKLNREFNLIAYNDIVEGLPPDFRFGEEGITYDFWQETEVETAGVHNSIFKLKIPIISETYDEEYAIDIVYTYYDDLL